MNTHGVKYVHACIKLSQTTKRKNKERLTHTHIQICNEQVVQARDKILETLTVRLRVQLDSSQPTLPMAIHPCIREH